MSHLLCDTAMEGTLSEVKRLLESGQAVITERYGGYTALLWAAYNDHVHVVQYLLEEGGASVTEQDGAGNTPLLCAVDKGSLNTATYLLRHKGANITETDRQDRTVWFWFKYHCDYDNGIPVQKADLYSLLRCFGSPDPNPDAFIATISVDHRYFTLAHRELLQQTERAHSNPNLLPYRLHRLDLLGRERDGGSDCARWLIPDLQNIVLEYLSDPAALLAYLPDAALGAEAVIAEAAAANEWARADGRNVRHPLA